MTTRTNAFEMLGCIVDCCKYSMKAAVSGGGGGADELLPVIIYVVLKVSTYLIVPDILFFKLLIIEILF